MEKHEFKPKEWVLVRDFDEQKWKLDIFSHYIEGNMYPYRCVSANYAQCIPYEGSESLLGTNKTADAPMEIGGWKVGDKVEVQYCWDDKWYTGTIIEIDPDHTNFDGEEFPYRVAASCFHDSYKSSRWCSREQLRKPEEKPESAKGWRPEKGEVVEALVDDEWQTATLILDDHTAFAPYRVRLQNGDKTWRTKEQVRPARKKPEEEEFKFGDKVEIRKDGEWCEAVVIEIDHSDIPYKVATADGDIHWRRKGDVRHA